MQYILCLSEAKFYSRHVPFLVGMFGKVDQFHTSLFLLLFSGLFTSSLAGKFEIIVVVVRMMNTMPYAGAYDVSLALYLGCCYGVEALSRDNIKTEHLPDCCRNQ